jgi:lantibiotic modifying enzyme
MECGVAPARYCEGLGDVVLFTAASGAADLAQGAARTLRRTMDMINGRPGKRNSQTIDLRFATLVYPLARAAALALNPELNEGAKVALGFITPATLAADKHLDMVQGTAGFLLGALAMHEIDASAGGLEKAIECGNHLLARRSNWPCYEGAPALGLAFGLAGVILALARLAHISGQERFLDAAKAAFRFEWKQRQQAPGDPGWAEGQTGFGYACLAMLPHLGAEAQDALEAAIQTAATSTDIALDSLYSGIFGRVDFLIEAASACGRSDLLDRARAMAAWSIDRASRRGGFALIPGAAAGMWAPGICYGAAGIGYTLLRLLDPCTVPPLVARG